mmetsp:Transcript_98709/g.181033  ORF Transcript_98709/g.181033 Transcript_98709/m.181033 type:complete len:222 (+) Transcript_98709:272-937(+)
MKTASTPAASPSFRATAATEAARLAASSHAAKELAPPSLTALFKTGGCSAALAPSISGPFPDARCCRARVKVSNSCMAARRYASAASARAWSSPPSAATSRLAAAEATLPEAKSAKPAARASVPSTCRSRSWRTPPSGASGRIMCFSIWKRNTAKSDRAASPPPIGSSISAARSCEYLVWSATIIASGGRPPRASAWAKNSRALSNSREFACLIAAFRSSR